MEQHKKKIDNCKIIEDPRLIAGYLRDALFNKNCVYIKCNHLPLNAVIKDISEKTARDKNAPRNLIIEVLNFGNALTPLKPLNGALAEISIIFDRFILEFQANVISQIDKDLVFQVPSYAISIKKRKSHRFNAKELSNRICTVLLDDGNAFKEFASFELQDISKDGYGGIITTSNYQIPDAKISISGKLLLNIGAIPIDGQISWHRQYDSSLNNIFLVGIKNNINIPSDNNPKIIERRILPRARAEIPIEIVSPLFPNTPALLKLEDLSLMGLKAKFMNLADSVLFRNGMEVSLLSPKLKLQVQLVNDSTISFSILKSSVEEHIKCFNLVTFLNEKDIALGTFVGTDLTQVFNTSGSFSTALARSLSSNREQILRTAVRSDDQNPQWFLRWMQQDSIGRIKSVILTAPYSDHVWYLGGLAGHLDPELKMDGNFVARYFNSLNNFLTSLGGTEYLFFNWFKTNSWWDSWEVHLKQFTESTNFFRIEGAIAYFKNTSCSEFQLQNEYKWERITQGNVKKSEKILSNISTPKISRLFQALGLSPFSMGCSGLADLLNRSNHNFSRKFFKIEFPTFWALCALSTFPPNVFPNGIINYPFLYISKKINEVELSDLAFKTLELCTAEGIECPALFICSVDGFEHLVDNNRFVLKEIIWTFGNTQVLDFWRDK